jgi:hypothetical protein
MDGIIFDFTSPKSNVAGANQSEDGVDLLAEFRAIVSRSHVLTGSKTRWLGTGCRCRLAGDQFVAVVRKWVVRCISAVMVILALFGCASYDAPRQGVALDRPDPGAWYGQ